MKQSYFALWYRLDQKDEYLIWYSDNSADNGGFDKVLTDEQRRLLNFEDLSTLKKWMQANRLPLVDEGPILHDLDVVQDWLRQPTNETIDCAGFLNAWNLFSDIKASLADRNILREEKELLDVYDKLFYGSNLPSMTPEGKHYVPIWTDEEIHSLCRILGQGLGLFQKCRAEADLAAEWLRASRRSLKEVWDNDEDAVYDIL